MTQQSDSGFLLRAECMPKRWGTASKGQLCLAQAVLCSPQVLHTLNWEGFCLPPAISYSVQLLASTTAYRTKRTKAPFPNHYPVRRWALLGGSVLSKFWLGMLTLAIDRHNANFDATDYMQIFRVDHQYHHVWTADKTRSMLWSWPPHLPLDPYRGLNHRISGWRQKTLSCYRDIINNSNSNCLTGSRTPIFRIALQDIPHTLWWLQHYCMNCWSLHKKISFPQF